MPRPQTGRPELALNAALRGDAGLLELEDVLHLDLLAFHAGDLSDLHDLAGAVGHARRLDYHVDGRGDLLADRLQWQLDAGHEDQRLDALQRLARRVGVDRGDRAVVAGVHGL